MNSRTRFQPKSIHLLVSILIGAIPFFGIKYNIFGYDISPYLIIFFISVLLTVLLLIVLRKSFKESVSNKVIYLFGIIYLGTSILGTLVIAKLWWNESNFVEDLVIIEVESWANRLDAFKAKCGRYPMTNEGLKSLILFDDKSKCPNYPPGGFTQGGVVWGHDFSYNSDGVSYTLKRNAGGDTFIRTDKTATKRRNKEQGLKQHTY